MACIQEPYVSTFLSEYPLQILVINADDMLFDTGTNFPQNRFAHCKDVVVPTNIFIY